MTTPKVTSVPSTKPTTNDAAVITSTIATVSSSNAITTTKKPFSKTPQKGKVYKRL
jgi:hypothetical protein